MCGIEWTVSHDCKSIGLIMDLNRVYDSSLNGFLMNLCELNVIVMCKFILIIYFQVLLGKGQWVFRHKRSWWQTIRTTWCGNDDLFSSVSRRCWNVPMLRYEPSWNSSDSECGLPRSVWVGLNAGTVLKMLEYTLKPNTAEILLYYKPWRPAFFSSWNHHTCLSLNTYVMGLRPLYFLILSMRRSTLNVHIWHLCTSDSVA